MLPNQVIQSAIEELRNITKIDLCVMDAQGTVLASTTEQIGISQDIVREFVACAADSQAVNGHFLYKVTQEEGAAYLILSKGGEDAYMTGRIAASQIRQLMAAYKERLDRDSFLQNLILDNLLLVDIHNRAKRLHIPTEADRAVLLIETAADDDMDIMELMKGLFLAYNGDYLITVEERNIILIKALSEGDGYEFLQNTAEMIVDMVNSEAMVNVRVSYGTIVHELKDVSKSFKEAKLALEVGKIFYIERDVTAFHRLGIGRLIYQLPENLCRIFIQEVFGSDTMPKEIDEEILTTVQKFFENNLNISETARRLFIHRNTLVYRIDKVQKATGLDMRIFEDALTFNIALMVVNYLKYVESINS